MLSMFLKVVYMLGWHVLYWSCFFFSCCIQVLVLVVLLLFCMEGLILDREPQLHLIRYIYMHTYIYTHIV